MEIIGQLDPKVVYGIAVGIFILVIISIIKKAIKLAITLALLAFLVGTLGPAIEDYRETHNIEIPISIEVKSNK